MTKTPTLDQQPLPLGPATTPIEAKDPPADPTDGVAAPEDDKATPDSPAELGDGTPPCPIPDISSNALLRLHPRHCRLSPLNGRDPAQLDAGSLSGLMESIRSAGAVVTPILVMLTGDPETPYEVVAGARRWAAAAELIGKLPDLRLPAIAIAGDTKTGAVATDAENRGRRGPSAYERGRGYKAALASGAATTKAELGKLLGVREATVSELSRLVDWPSALFEAYGGPHRILAVDAEDISPLLLEHEDKLIAKAKLLTPAPGCPALPRAEVTRQLLRAVGKAPTHLTDLVIVGTDDRPLLSITRRRERERDVTLRMTTHAKASHGDLKKAFAKLLELLESGQRGTARI